MLRKSAVLEADIYYDNTREPVIWEIVALIENTLNQIQKSRSEEILGDFLTKFDLAMNKMNLFKANLIKTNQKLDGYIGSIYYSTGQLKDARADLVTTLDSMDEDISDVKAEKAMLKSEKDSFYFNAHNQINTIRYYAGYISIEEWYKVQLLNSISQLDNRLISYNSDANEYLISMDSRINQYESMSRKGRTHVSEIETGIGQLNNIRQDLYAYKSELSGSEREISSVQTDFGSLRGADAGKIVNPLRVNKLPVYQPSAEIVDKYKEKTEDGNDVKTALRGFSLLSLQTIFPTMLFLIILFISLLIASFMTLNEINSPANKRIKLIRGIFFHEFLSIYVSTAIIMVLPMAYLCL